MACSRVRRRQDTAPPGGSPARQAQGVAVAGKQLPRLFNQALGKHGARTGVDALVKLRALGIEAEPQDAIAGQGFPFLPGLGHGPGSGQRNLDGSYDLGEIVGMDAGSRGWVETLEDAVEPDGAPRFRLAEQAIAQGRRPLRSGKQALQQSTKVKAGASGNDGQPASAGDGGDGGACSRP